MKYTFDGTLPDINQKAVANAAAVMERIKSLQSNQIQLLEMQCENMRKIQQANAFNNGGGAGMGPGGKKQFNNNNNQWNRNFGGDENMNPNFN